MNQFLNSAITSLIAAPVPEAAINLVIGVCLVAAACVSRRRRAQ
jgi:hypothetical protein